MRRTIEHWLYPALTGIAPQHRQRALHRAREEPLDLLELGGIALAIVCVAAITRYTLVDASIATRLTAGFSNFLIALPLLVVGIGPFHVRRVRRGLAEFMKPRK